MSDSKTLDARLRLAEEIYYSDPTLKKVEVKTLSLLNPRAGVLALLLHPKGEDTPIAFEIPEEALVSLFGHIEIFFRRGLKGDPETSPVEKNMKKRKSDQATPRSTGRAVKIF